MTHAQGRLPGWQRHISKGPFHTALALTQNDAREPAEVLEVNHTFQRVFSSIRAT
jgi:hypothetical protein